jgi:hypothetical protein
MKIEKLTSDHSNALKTLFLNTEYMGISRDQFDDSIKAKLRTDDIGQIYHETFCSTYLSGLRSYHAYGCINEETDEITSLISFYESTDNAEWYWTQVRSIGNNQDVKMLLDKVIEHNEIRGRFKFYSMWNVKYQRIYRRFAFSKYNNERYDYFDEYVVPSKTRCLYTVPWMVLYNRTLVPVDSIVRCSFLKQQYRKKLSVAGNI